ncbi:MAG: hypothetical protein ABSG32_22115 [Terriglobia bacterium]|jgi:hypothetical protein
MHSNEQVARLRHLFHAEHLKIGLIAAELCLHPDIVRATLDTDHIRSHSRFRNWLTDRYLDFLHQTSLRYIRLRAPAPNRCFARATPSAVSTNSAAP